MSGEIDSACFAAFGGSIVKLTFPNRVGARGLMKVDPRHNLLCALPPRGIERLEDYFVLDARAAAHEWELSA